jgi:hypothetical protein
MLTFTYSALQKFLIDFSPDQTGSFHDAGGAAVNIRGRINGGVLDADVTNSSGGCEHHWHLKRSQ